MVPILNCAIPGALQTEFGSSGILYEGMTTSGPWGNGRNILDFSNQGHWGGSWSGAVLNPDGTVKTPRSSGQGHGWTTANSVAWHCDLTNQANPTVSGQMFCQKTPTAQNFAIGCKGWITMAQITRQRGKEAEDEDWKHLSSPKSSRILSDFFFQRQMGPGHVEPRGGSGTGDDIDHRYTVQEAKYKEGTAFGAVSLTPLTSAAQNAAFDTLEPKSLHEAQRNVANKLYQTESLALSPRDTTATVTPGTYRDDSGVVGTDVLAAPRQTVTFLLPNVQAGTYRVFVGVKGDSGKGRLTLHTADSPTASFATTPVGTADTYAALPTMSELKVGEFVSGSVNNKKFRFTYTPTASSNGLTFDYIRLQRLD